MDNLTANQCRAYLEEFLAATYLIAAFLAFNAGWNVMGWILLAKAAIDTLGAIFFWGKERSKPIPRPQRSAVAPVDQHLMALESLVRYHERLDCADGGGEPDLERAVEAIKALRGMELERIK